MTSLNKILSQFGKMQGEVKNPGLSFRSLSFDVLHLGGWKGDMGVLRSEISKVCGLEVSDSVGKIFSNNDFILLPLGFEKYRLLAKPSNLPKSLLGLDSGIGVSVLQSDSFYHLGVSGVGVREFLRLVFMIDVDEGIFGDGDFAVSLYHHVGVGVYCLDGEFVLCLPSGVGEGLCETLLETGRSFGIKV